jgi:hypothetical protein
MQFSSQNLYKLRFSALSSGSLAALFLGLGASHAAAQITIQSTGTISGTLEFPFGPNTNGRVTRIDTDKNGTYFRNIGTKNNPNLVPVYSSKFVQIQTNPDGSIKSFVDFLGLQFISPDGSITSPVLSGGKLQPYKYQGRPDPKFLVNFQAAVQDEFGLQKAFYEGIVTDPKTGQQYQGVFEVNGQGPRYSDRNGGDSPTVFDFKTDYDPKGIRPKPALNSYKMTNTPLVRLTIKVPAGMQPINPVGGTTTPVTPPVGGTTTPVTPPVGGTITPVTPPISGTITPVTPPAGGTITPVTSPISGTTTPVMALVNSGSSITTPTSPTISTPISPTNQPNVEFSSGTSLAVNSDTLVRQISSGNEDQLNTTNIEQAACLQDTVNCRPRQNQSRQIGPRSRVIVR